MRPETEDALAEIVGDAAAARRPLLIEGGGSRQALGRPVQAAETVSTTGLKGVSLYEPGALTLVVRAGEPLASVESLLAKEGQRLAFEPMDSRRLLKKVKSKPTIGGVVATAASGPRRVQVGGCRDTLIGARFVNGKGEVVKAGGRVMKNVTGYDLARLMAGAYGTLGVLTEIAFKVLPAPERAASILLHGLSDADAVRALGSALGSPFDVSGAAHLPPAQTVDDDRSVTMIRVEGFADSVAYRAERLRALLKDFGAADIVEDQERVAAGWAYIRDCLPFAGRDGAVWRISVKPSEGPSLAEAIAARRDADWWFDLGGGLIWLLTPEDDDAGAAAIRDESAKLGARATLFRASAAIRSAVPPFPPEPATTARLAAGLKAAFDPQGVLNPGRLVG